MQLRFDEWLEEKLDDRGWQAADLARASKTPDYPRGFDPGLISRWRKPPPMGVVPLPPTLDRLAAALQVPIAEVYGAAGRLPPVGANTVREAVTHDDAEIDARKFVAALRGVPKKFRVAVLNASIALANAYGDLPTPVTSPGEPRLTDHVAAGNEGETDSSGRLPVPNHGRVFQFAGAGA